MQVLYIMELRYGKNGSCSAFLHYASKLLIICFDILCDWGRSCSAFFFLHNLTKCEIQMYSIVLMFSIEKSQKWIGSLSPWLFAWNRLCNDIIEKTVHNFAYCYEILSCDCISLSAYSWLWSGSSIQNHIVFS